MLDEPLITFIVPAYNTDRYLEECLNSMVKQTGSNYEVVVVDDCSSDDTSAIAMKFREVSPVITVVKHDQNLGLGAARNSGLKLARGKYVSFIDSDDFLDPYFVENLTRHILKFDSDLILTLPKVYCHKTKEVSPWMDSQLFYKILGNHSERAIDTHIESDVFDLEVSSCRKVFRRDCLIKSSILFSEGVLFEDFRHHFEAMWTLRKCSITETTSFFYRVNRENQITAQRDSRRIEVIDVFREALHCARFFQFGPRVMISLYRWMVEFSFWCFTSTPLEHRGVYLRSLSAFGQSVELQYVRSLWNARSMSKKKIVFFFLSTYIPIGAQLLNWINSFIPLKKILKD